MILSNFTSTLSRVAGESGLLWKTQPADELFAIPNFPWIKLARNDFDESLSDPEPKGPRFEFIIDCTVTASMSFGQLVNSFYELEPVYTDYWNRHYEPKLWSVGPLCLAEPPTPSPEHESSWIDEWLDRKLDQGQAVLYVVFGSQAEISAEQFQEIKSGLERSQVNFLWVIRKNESQLNDGFEERVKDRGLIVREWVDQRKILGHRSVVGFLSHCGWNSVLERMKWKQIFP
ncbi:UDP-glycosyltransferase 90A1-like [Coffea eugenioides]|uniref:UDP-glycosyltransferase 90A1-like n=1 Tax=Coffea eugenioides TaxID=49369 RepID=UPI000F614290|nr:UDP-glycosyltransferase 90A1-like [Coffea eugenioides]